MMKTDELNDRWNIESLYPSDEAWENDYARLTETIEKISGFAGRMDDAKTLLEYLQFTEEMYIWIEKVVLYPHLKADEDVTNADYAAMDGRAESLGAEIMAQQSFFEPEILGLPEDRVDEMFREQPELEKYRFLIESILRGRRHIRSGECEEILAYAGDCFSGIETASHILSDSDMEFEPVTDENGEEQELSEGNYPTFLFSQNRSVRKSSFVSLMRGYGKYANTFCSLLTSSVKNCVFNANIRNYDTALESVLDSDNIPTSVYMKAIDEIEKGLPELHRFVAMKKKILGIDEMHLYDLNAPSEAAPKTDFDFSDGVEIVLKALEPMGSEYTAKFREGIENRWIDRYPRKGKASGAYSSGGYDTMPFVLMNYNGTEEDVLTLAHEMGHSLHTCYTNSVQPAIYSGYALFCAEVASTTNEVIVSRYMADHETDKARRLRLIFLQLDQIRSSVFRQVMFAEFELYMHDAVERMMQPTTDDLCRKWHELNVKYYGEGMIIDDEADIEWARIPHFYSDFYVYQYATGYAAANAFAEAITSGKAGALDKYLKFLKSGCSDYPVAILQKAGVDLTGSEPYASVVRRFKSLLDEAESFL